MDDKLHVYISSDTEDKLQRGINRINDLITEATSQYQEGI